jgi:hypothetical protein
MPFYKQSCITREEYASGSGVYPILVVSNLQQNERLIIWET